MKKFILIGLLFITGFINAQTIQQKLMLYNNSQTNGGDFSFYYQIKGSNMQSATTLGSLCVDLIYDSTAINFSSGSEWYSSISPEYGYVTNIQSNNSEDGKYKAVRISAIAQNVNADGKNTKPGYDLETEYRNIVKVNFIILDRTKTINILIKSETNQIGLFANKNNNPNTFEILDEKLSNPIMLNDIPLPIHLAEFSGDVTGRNINLKWKTSFEQNNYGFDIERKSENGAFSKVGFIAGNNKNSEYTFCDKKLNNGKYSYRLKQIDNNGNYEYYNLSNELIIGIPQKYNISQNYPNPFNPTTKIDIELPFNSKVTLVVYDLLGREVKSILNNETKEAGYHTVDLNASMLSSGTYFYKLDAKSVTTGNEFSQIKKMTLIK